MSENEYFHETRESRIRNWILYQMLRGAGWAALIAICILAFYLVLRLISGFLPENPNAALDVIDAIRAVTALA